MTAKIYENGNLYQIGKLASRKRNHYDLNFNPIRQAKYSLAANVKTKFNKILFNDSANNEKSLESVIRGTYDLYSLGCYEPKSQSVKQNQLQEDSSATLNDQCKKVCLSSLQQIYLLKDLACICVANRFLFLVFPIF